MISNTCINYPIYMWLTISGSGYIVDMRESNIRGHNGGRRGVMIMKLLENLMILILNGGHGKLRIIRGIIRVGFDRCRCNNVIYRRLGAFVVISRRIVMPHKTRINRVWLVRPQWVQTLLEESPRPWGERPQPQDIL